MRVFHKLFTAYWTVCKLPCLLTTWLLSSNLWVSQKTHWIYCISISCQIKSGSDLEMSLSISYYTPTWKVCTSHQSNIALYYICMGDTGVGWCEKFFWLTLVLNSHLIGTKRNPILLTLATNFKCILSWCSESQISSVQWYRTSYFNGSTLPVFLFCFCSNTDVHT